MNVPQTLLAATLLAALGPSSLGAAPAASVRVPAAWLQFPEDPRPALEKLSGSLRTAAAGPSTLAVDCLVTFRQHAGLWIPGSLLPGDPLRNAWSREVQGRLVADFGPLGASVVQSFTNFPVVRMSVPARLLASLAADPRVEGISPNGIKRAFDAEGEGLMQVPPVRAMGYDGAGIGVAVVDTGVDYNHPEFEGRVVKLYDSIDHDNDPMDGFGHGTAVAGIVAGATTGVARKATIVAVRVLDNTGQGTDANLLEGLDAVLQTVASGNPYNVRVVNLSLGGYIDETKPPDPGRCDALQCDYKAVFDALLEYGVLSTVASGNGGCTTGIASPACISSVFSVGAVFDASIAPRFYGAGQCLRGGCGNTSPQADTIPCYCDTGDQLGGFAPSDCATAPRPGGGTYACFSGTSAAAPYAAGAAALLIQAEPARSVIDIREALRNTGKPITDNRNGITRNRIDILKALDLLRTVGATGESVSLLVPVVLDVAGLNGSHYETEATLGNSGSLTATVALSYVPATRALPAAAGKGAVVLSLAPGEQRTIPAVIAFLRDNGLAIPPGAGQGGSLRVTFKGLSSASAGTVSTRTTSPACEGRAGLSIPGVRVDRLFQGAAALYGLRESQADRTNLALVNGGTLGTIRLQVSLHSGALDGSAPWVVPDLPELAPGEWYQINSADLLKKAGMTDAWAVVERISGSEPYDAYAIINDNGTNDGSFVPAAPWPGPSEIQIVPAIVEAGAFRSELTLTNPGPSGIVATLTYFESLGSPSGYIGVLDVPLGPEEQQIIPDIVGWLRSRGLAIGPLGGSYAGALKVQFRDGKTTVRGFAGARTAAPALLSCVPSGSFGLFYPGVGTSSLAGSEAWVTGLQQNATTRANLALVNPGLSGGSIDLSYQVFDGTTGLSVFTSPPVTLEPLRWIQVDGVLDKVCLTTGFVRVFRANGTEPFLAYAVLNDGAKPGQRTGDGSYLAMKPGP